jgi:integral membrane protein
MASLVHPFTNDLRTPAVANIETSSGQLPKSVTALRRLRLTSTPEAVSFLLLLICSVLKRTTEFNGVPVMGAVHGFLFVLYVLFWADAWNRNKWPVGIAAVYFVLSVLPFGGFFADRKLRREEEAGVLAARGERSGNDGAVNEPVAS